MSLIPYHPREGREIVLRHHNAIVVRDPSSQRLEIRGLQLTESVRCPTCQRPLRSSSPDRHYNGVEPEHHETYVNPEYFRMLRAGASTPHGRTRPDTHPPSSPIRRLVEPVQPLDEGGIDAESVHGAEFVSSTPAPQEGSRIRREAFSPNYFSTFFTEERELGRGGKGVVLLVRHEIDGCHLGHFACKRVPVGDDHAWLEKVLVEVELLAKLSHPNLVSYRHVWLEDVQFNRFGPSVACAFILQQYCNGGDLLNYVIGDLPKEATKEQLKAQMRRRSRGHGERPQGIFQSRRLPFEEIYSLFKDITSGLAYLHAANYIHRDLKPSNCLLHREGKNLVCLISDFGEVQPENVVRKSTGSTGTISYCAPEVLKRDTTGRYGNFTTKSDIFSLGMILYFMCFGRLPYQSANTVHEELEDIDLLRAEITDWKGFQDERRSRPDLPSKLYQLLKKLLSVSPAERPTANEVLIAMKSESSLDGVGRSARSSSPPIGLGGHRIQNLDSPLPPSTPVPGSFPSPDFSHSVHTLTSRAAISPEPSKHHAHVTSPEDDLGQPRDEHSPQPHSHNSLQKRDYASSHLHGHSMALSRSHEGFRRSPSHSPTRATLDILGPPLAGGSSGDGHDPHPTPGLTTPLLMPPATTTLGQIKHQALLARYRAVRWAYHNAESIALSTRLMLFLLKMVSLSWMCWPYSFSPGIGMSLVALAGLDLGLPAGTPRVFHRVRANVGGLGGHDGVVAHPVAVSRWHWYWDWRASTLLLMLHFLVLWLTDRYAALCALTHHVHGKWAEW